MFESAGMEERPAEAIATLRASLAKPGLARARLRIPLGHAEADFCLKGGLERGALHEVLAVPGHEAAATGFMGGLAQRLSGERRLLWIRQDYAAAEFGELSAVGLFDLGLDPARLLLLHVRDAIEALRAASDALGCAGLGAVVIEMVGRPGCLDLTASRRLTLAAAQRNVTALLLRFGARADASTAETRWRVAGAASPRLEENWGQPAYEAELIRNRNGQTGHWVMEWSCDHGLFQKPADRGAVVSLSRNRQGETA